MLTAITTNRGRLEAIEEFCDICGAAEATRRGWPRTDGTVGIGRGWSERVTYKRGVQPGCCQSCGMGRQAQLPGSAA